MRCADCKHWNIGECEELPRRLQLSCDCNREQDDYARRTITVETPAEFGCVLYEAKGTTDG